MQQPRRWILRSLILATALCVGAGAQAGQIVDRAVAVVNNDVVTERDLHMALAAIVPPGRGIPPLIAHELRQKAIDHLIDEKLLEQAMLHGHVELSPEEQDSAYQHFLQEHHMTEAQLQSALTAHGMTLPGFRDHMSTQLRQMKFVQSEVGKNVRLSDQEMQDFYHRNQQKFADTSHADFNRLKPQIQQALYQEKMAGALEQYVGRLRAKAYIEVMK